MSDRPSSRAADLVRTPHALDALARARARELDPGPWPRRVRRCVRRLRRAARDGTLAGLFGAMGLLLRPLPLGVALALAARLGAALAPAARDAWRRTDEHLALAFPAWSAAERRRVARASFANLARSLVEIAKFPAVRRVFDTYVEARGLEHLRDGLRAGRGVLAVTGHVGNWELLAAYCALHGLPVDVVGRRLHSPLLNRMLVAFRRRSGITTIQRESGGSARAILRTLHANRILALLIDQDTRGPAVYVPFFGRPARTPSGAAVLARRRAVPVVPIFISRRAEGGHVIEAHPPLSADSAATIEELTASYTAAIEVQIRRRPSEWVWWHRRWRHRPSDGNP